jgi:hypothetical protein
VSGSTHRHVTLESRPRPAESVIAAVIDDEAVLYDEAGENLHHLDRIATVVWQLADGRATVAELVTELAEAFGADELTVQTDVLALLDSLVEKGVITLG